MKALLFRTGASTIHDFAEPNRDIRGWQMQCENGWIFSVTWDRHTYSEPDGSLVEIAAFTEDRSRWFDFDKNEITDEDGLGVIGHVPQSEIFGHLHKIHCISTKGTK